MGKGIDERVEVRKNKGKKEGGKVNAGNEEVSWRGEGLKSGEGIGKRWG